jgi:hypothetical protein
MLRTVIAWIKVCQRDQADLKPIPQDGSMIDLGNGCWIEKRYLVDENNQPLFPEVN